MVTATELSSYISFMTTLDAFEQTWGKLGRNGQAVYMSMLRQIDHLRRDLKATGNLLGQYLDASVRLREFFRTVPDFDFKVQPEPAEWIEWCMDISEVVATHLTAWERLESMLLRHGVSYMSRWNSMKRGANVAKIVDSYTRMGKTLDLWDVVRFRIVLADIARLKDFCALLIASFQEDIVRVRNYYFRPRNNILNPYRAVHFELAVEIGSCRRYYELQAVTIARDAVGLLDHEFLYKADASENEVHREWLMDLRLAANIFDLVNNEK